MRVNMRGNGEVLILGGEGGEGGEGERGGHSVTSRNVN